MSKEEKIAQKWKIRVENKKWCFGNDLQALKDTINEMKRTSGVKTELDYIVEIDKWLKSSKWIYSRSFLLYEEVSDLYVALTLTCADLENTSKHLLLKTCFNQSWDEYNWIYCLEKRSIYQQIPRRLREPLEFMFRQ